MKKFAFRQRVGSLNWKIVSGVDIERVVDELQIEELQSALDSVTFCEIKKSDIKSSTVENTCHLVQIMQLMLEYMLYCQESQLQLVRQMRKRNQDLKKHDEELAQRNVSLKEDVKIYQRQLAMLRDSLLKVQNSKHLQQPRSLVFQDENTSPLMESMLRHERDTQKYALEMLKDQRNAFLEELTNFATKNSNTHNTKSIEDRLEKHMERLLSQLQNTIQSNEDNHTTQNKTLKQQEKRELKLNEFERLLNSREIELNDLEDELEKRIQALDKQQKQQQQQQVNQQQVDQQQQQRQGQGQGQLALQPQSQVVAVREEKELVLLRQQQPIKRIVRTRVESGGVGSGGNREVVVRQTKGCMILIGLEKRSTKLKLFVYMTRWKDKVLYKHYKGEYKSLQDLVDELNNSLYGQKNQVLRAQIEANKMLDKYHHEKLHLAKEHELRYGALQMRYQEVQEELEKSKLALSAIPIKKDASVNTDVKTKLDKQSTEFQTKYLTLTGNFEKRIERDIVPVDEEVMMEALSNEIFESISSFE